ncbi:MAG TPA: hypothetical protein DCP28_22525, partial [Cytophagales bacterium]|nr:hypothetical protein [Cytophagales bacterium]
VDTLGRLWRLGSNGLQVSTDTTWGDFKNFPMPGELQPNWGEADLDPVLWLPNGRVLFAHQQQLFCFREGDGSYHEIPLPLDPSSRQDSRIRYFLLDGKGRPVFEFQGHIYRLEHDESITHLWASPNRDKILSTWLFQDPQGVLWYGTEGEGLYRINTLTPDFATEKYQQNYLVDILTNELGVPLGQIPANWQQSFWAYGLRYQETPRGLVLTQESYGYGDARRIYSLENGKLSRWNLPEQDKNYIIGLGNDSTGWYAVDIAGYYFYWSDLNSLPEITRLKMIENTAQERLSDLVVDEQYQWLLSARHGLYQVQNGAILDSFALISEDYKLVDLCQDPTDADILWISSLGGGLLKWSKQEKQVVKIFTDSDGLAENNVAVIVPDDYQNLWVATFNGISKLNLTTQRFSNYNKKDGLLESEYNRFHGMKLPDGRIALGGTAGYAIFDPEAFQDDTYSPNILLGSFQVNEVPIWFGPDSEGLDQPLNRARELSLGYNENTVSFQLSTDQYNDPTANRFRYQLTDYNRNWVELGTNRTVRFDQLPPGD